MEEDIKVLEDYLDKQDRKFVSEYRLMILQAIENLIKEYKKIEKQIDLEWVENNYIEKSKYNELVKRNNELEENRIYKSQLNSAFDNGFISKSKAKEKIEERFGILCMQLGSYERDNATSEQERIAGGINELRKLKRELLQEGDDK